MLSTRREPYPLPETFRRDWQALRTSTPGDSVFTDLDWIEAGIRTSLPATQRPVALRFLDAGGATAALALLREAPLPSRMGRLHTLRTIELNSQRIPPVVAADVPSMGAALQALWSDLGGAYDVLDFFKLDGLDGGLPALVGQLRSSGIRARLVPFNQQPRLTLPASVNDLLHLRNKVSRKKLRWGCNRLEEQLGPLELVRLRTPDQLARFGLAALRDTLFELAGRSWQGQGGDPADLAVRRAFFTDVSDAFAPRGMLDVCLLRAGGRFVAFDLNLVERDVVSMLVGAYDPAWARFSPGSQLFARWAADSLARGDRVLEFGGDFLEYKEHWATETLPSYHLRLFGRTLRGRLKALLERQT